MSTNTPLTSENLGSSLFALPLAALDEQGEFSSKDKGARKKHNWKQMENMEELKSCKANLPFLVIVLLAFDF